MSDTQPAPNRRLDFLLVLGVMSVVLLIFVGYRTEQNAKQIAHDYQKIEVLEQVVQEDDQTFGALGERLRQLERSVHGTVGDDQDDPEETLALLRRDLREANKRLNTLAKDLQARIDAQNKLIRAVEKLERDVRMLERGSVKTVAPGKTSEDQAKPGEDAGGEDLRGPK